MPKAAGVNPKIIAVERRNAKSDALCHAICAKRWAASPPLPVFLGAVRPPTCRNRFLRIDLDHVAA